MAEVLKSSHGSSVPAGALSVLSLSTSDTSSCFLSSTCFVAKYSLRNNCDADLRFLNIFQVAGALRQTIGDFPLFDRSSDKSITVSDKSKSITLIRVSL